MKKIVCPTDFSRTAEKAMHYAAWIAQRTGGKLTLLHAVQSHLLDNEEAVMANMQVVAGLLSQAERTLTDTGRQLREKYRGDNGNGPLEVETVVREGLLVNLLDRMRNEKTCELVVMGTTGGGGDRLEDLIVGSNTVRVLDNLSCPVIAVPRSAHLYHLEKIVFGTDYQQNDSDALHELLDFAAHFNAQVHVLHVSSDDSDEAEEAFQQFARPIARDCTYDKIHFARISHHDPEEGLMQFAEQMHADMIVLQAKEHGFFKRLYHQSLTEQLSYHSKIPLMVLHVKKEQ